MREYTWIPGVRRLSAWIMSALVVMATADASAQDQYIVLTSDPGDYIGGGESRLITDADAAITSAGSPGNGFVRITAFPYAGGFWYLEFAAPAGQELVPGAYEDATRWPFNAPTEPGLSISGDGRGCNTLTGRFDVLEAQYGPNGYVERFHALFEQHCEGAGPALRGEVFVSNPPPPPPLEITLTILSRGEAARVTGTAIVRGTVACTAPTSVSLFGRLMQRANRFALASGTFSQLVACSATAAPWAATVASDNNVPFNPGSAQLEVRANAFDPNYPEPVSEETNVGIQLVRARR